MRRARMMKYPSFVLELGLALVVLVVLVFPFW